MIYSRLLLFRSLQANDVILTLVWLFWPTKTGVVLDMKNVDSSIFPAVKRISLLSAVINQKWSRASMTLRRRQALCGTALWMHYDNALSGERVLWSLRGGAATVTYNYRGDLYGHTGDGCVLYMLTWMLYVPSPVLLLLFYRLEIENGRSSYEFWRMRGYRCVDMRDAAFTLRECRSAADFMIPWCSNNLLAGSEDTAAIVNINAFLLTLCSLISTDEPWPYDGDPDHSQLFKMVFSA